MSSSAVSCLKIPAVLAGLDPGNDVAAEQDHAPAGVLAVTFARPAAARVRRVLPAVPLPPVTRDACAHRPDDQRGEVGVQARADDDAGNGMREQADQPDGGDDADDEPEHNSSTCLMKRGRQERGDAVCGLAEEMADAVRDDGCPGRVDDDHPGDEADKQPPQDSRQAGHQASFPDSGRCRSPMARLTARAADSATAAMTMTTAAAVAAVRSSCQETPRAMAASRRSVLIPRR